ncbi:uncharacterized protein LOC124436343 isoform X2 [Xenia sp. Carnegie-2017]|uniref:uncharacterized protein LOC124436343 isoform X2 n=1 Tax=Xenia sp. Carnegie-2017 TaxID=2897299 RepID=UPI001F03369E|nr:uncharacterized protein LOC124436343 isoform X2 [Xenia sp. Carnegie-2017]
MSLATTSPLSFADNRFQAPFPLQDGRLTLREIEEMDLKWYFSCKNRNWKVYKLENTGLNNHIALTDPMKFEKDFEKELKHHFNCRVCILFEKNILLTRISPCNEENLFLSLSSTIYMICVPRSSHVLMSNLKAAHKKFVLKAIENIFCCGLDEMDFCGRSDSLFNLILNMSSQGQFSNFRLNQIDENPLSRKRKRDIGNDDDNKENVMSVNEEHVKDKTRKIYALKTFGSHQQPALEKIEFKMFTKFKGGRYIGDEEQEEIKDVVKCSAQFKGKNVVEGIKKLCEHGLASQPLPSHLKNIPSALKTSFVLTDKKISHEK